MASAERDVSRERSMSPKHKHSFSDLTKLTVPMWDSSDPDRAPPPLPLNPQNPNTSPTRPNASENVAAAARALAERARESSGPNSYPANPSRDRSPEKSPTRTPQHKRLQSLQNGSLKDFKASLEKGRGSEWHNSRPVSPGANKDVFSSSPERNHSRSNSPATSDNRDAPRDAAGGRRLSRPCPRPILGENTPPSATMLAIQNMAHRDIESPPSNVADSSITRSPRNVDSILNQMQNLTSIATTLQKEMAALSRRSKDNATDLVSLKEATKTRDEDIRKSLRELVINARASDLGSLAPPRGDMSRSTSAMDFVPRYLEARPHHSPPCAKSVSLPRIPPVHGPDNVSDPDRAASPGPYSVEGAASIAMLEKIIRDMGTKEGQDRLLSALMELMDKSSKENASTVKKVEDLVEFISHPKNSKALVKHNGSSTVPGMDNSQVRENSDDSQIESLRAPSSYVVSEELKQVLQKIKDSVAQGGGMTGEVKSLVRELRGEVLGMGRELGRKLDKTGHRQNEQALVLAGDHVTKGDVGRIVQEGLAELKEHMDQLIQSKRRQSSSSALSRRSIDSSEVYALVKQSLAEQALERSNNLMPPQQPFNQEAIITAVKEAYEAYKPEIELQQFGLERDEILQCLKEGLEDYQSMKSTNLGISRDEVFEAVQEALQHFKPPAPVTEASEIKDEVLVAVRECLENFQPQSRERSEWQPGDITRDDILGAVREGLGNFKKEGAREIEISREDLFHAVKAGLDNTQTPFGGYGDEVLKSLHDIVEGMRVEFKEYSAANGRDTELVLDTTKDGLESLRVEIESYVDRCRDVTGKDEIIETLKSGIDDLQIKVARLTEGFRSDNISTRSEIVNCIQNQFEQLQGTILAQEKRGTNTENIQERLFKTLTTGLSDLQSSVQRSRGNDGPTDDVLDAMKEEFEQLREAILAGSTTHKEELLGAIQDSITNLSNSSGSRDIGSNGSEDLISAVRQELATLRDNSAAPVLHAGAQDYDHSILAPIRDSIDGLRTQLSAEYSEVTDETLGRIKEEFERIRETLGGSPVLGTTSAEKTDILEAIRDGLDGLREMGSRIGGDENITGSLELMREELELLRQSTTRSMAQTRSSDEIEDINSAIRTGFDELKSRIGTSLDITDRSAIGSDGVISAFHEGLTELRADIAKMADKPVDLDMTVSYDILDTLKDGLASLRADIERTNPGGSRANGDVVLSDGNPANQSLSKDDFDKLEVMLTRLQIKVEAMDQNAQANQTAQNSASVDSATREALTGIETMIYELRGTIDILVSQKSTGVSKDDIDALETLLQNTKAKIDDQVLPSLDASVTKDQLDAVEAVIRLTGESVEGLAVRLEGDLASKDDVAAVYQLLQNADSSIKGFKDKFDHESADKPSKDDLEAIERICDEIKDKVDSLPPSDVVPTKDDVEQITELIEKFKTSHDRFKSQYEADLEITAKAFDDRREESDKIIEHINDLKSLVTDSKDDIKSRLKRGNEDVRALDEILQGIEDKIDEAPNAVSDVQEVLQVVNREFERSHETMDNIQAAHHEKSATLLEKHETLHVLIAEELVRKLDDRFAEVLARHDEQQRVVEQAAHVVAGKAAQQDELLNDSRNMAEDLKLTIDTLGESVTAISPALRDATDKMGDDAKTVYNKVEDLYSRMDANHADSMNENQLVRQEISKSTSNVGALQDAIMSFQPQAMATLSNLLALVGEHYEHSKRFLNVPQDETHKSSIEETIRSTFASLPLPRIEDSPATLTTTFDDARLCAKLDEFIALGNSDDSKVHSKLDDLLNHASASEKTLPDLHKIDEIHQQLQTTAAEISAFVSFQTSMVTQEHENIREVARQATDDVTRCQSEKEDLELKISNLTSTRQSLAADVESLMADRDDLTNQKSRLAAEVSSLETALRIRREELQEMDVRADSLERRIIEGVMDHSRALLIAKQPKDSASMNLKRVNSNTSSRTVSTTTPSSVANTGMNLALSRKRSSRKNVVSSNPAARRILSLSQITSNVPNGSSVSASRPALGGLNNLKRSQSVKNPRTSWAGQGSVAEFDKENDSLKEESDEESEREEDYSRTGTSMTERSEFLGGSQRSMSERRTSLSTGASEYSYATGSYLTGSDSMRTTSYGSTIRSVVGGGSSMEESIVEDGDEEAEGQGNEIEARVIEEAEEMEDMDGVSNYAAPHADFKDLVIRPPDGYDSGLGSDLPTALAISQHGSDYFDSLVKEQSP